MLLSPPDDVYVLERRLRDPRAAEGELRRLRAKWCRVDDRALYAVTAYAIAAGGLPRTFPVGAFLGTRLAVGEAS